MAWTTPRTWVAGEVPTAATFNTHVKGNFDAIGGAWTAFTPTVQSWTLGNGTVAAAYMQAGKLVHFRIRVNWGSTTVTAATLTLGGLPIATHADFAAGLRWVARDASGPASFFGDADLLGAATAFNLRATTPFTWAADDYIVVTGTYEGA